MRARTCARPLQSGRGRARSDSVSAWPYVSPGNGALSRVQAADSYNRLLCLVNRHHSFFIHPATVHFNLRESSFDLTKIRRRQLNIACSQVLVQVIGTSCAGNRNNERLLRKQPSQRNLSRCCTLLLRKLSEKINHRHICCNVFRRKAWELRSHVHSWVELRLSIYFHS